MGAGIGVVLGGLTTLLFDCAWASVVPITVVMVVTAVSDAAVSSVAASAVKRWGTGNFMAGSFEG
jgi:hypothetical protein